MRTWSLSDLALTRPVTVGMALVATVLLGFIAMMKLPLAFLPSDESARLYVRLDVTRTSPHVLEREVIRPVEEQIAGLRDLSRMQTGSGSWGVRMNLEFRAGTDVDARKLELRDRLERARPNLPDTVQRIEIGSYSMADDPVMELQIASDVDLSKNYYLIERHIIRPIERIDGVSRVELEGVNAHELEIAVTLDAVDSAGVQLESLGAVVRDARQGHSMGVLRSSAEDLGVRSTPEPATVDHYAALPLPRGRARIELADQDRGSARLGELADVTIHPEVARRGIRLDGRPAVNLEVFATAGASTVEVTREIRRAIDLIHDDPALSGMQVVVFHDQGEMILETLGDLRNTGVWGGMLAATVLFGFLHRWRTTLAAALSLPLSVLATCGVLFLRGDELNCIVLLGMVLAVGMLIDNAVVIVESIARQTSRGRKPLDAARLGAREVGLATIASTLSSVIVFLSLIVGEEGDRMLVFLRPLGITFSIALISSLLVSQMVVPLLMGRLLPPSSKPVHNPIIDRVSAGYGWLVQRTVRAPRRMALAGLILAASAALPMTRIHVQLGEPAQKGNHLPIRVQVSGSNGWQAVGERIATMENVLLEQKHELGIENIACSFRDWGGNCRVYPVEPAQSESELEAFEARIQHVLPELPGVTYRLGEREFHWSENRDRNIVDFAIKGEDMATLMELAQRTADHLARELPRGSADTPDGGGYDRITTPFTEGAKEIEVALQSDKLHRLGLSAADVAQRISLAFQGLAIGRIQGPDGELGLRLSVEGMSEADHPQGGGPGLAQLRDLRISSPLGGEILLGSVADLHVTASPQWVQRVDRQTEVRIQVRFFSNEAEANRAVVDEAMAKLPLPPGYSWGEGTQWWRRPETNNLLINLGLALVLVYAVMASLFESFLQPLAILVTCVLGCFGAPYALWLTQTTLDMTSVIGLFILIGIVVNNGIMLVDKVTQLRAAGMNREQALQMAGAQRLRPILMTASTTILGLVPMLIHHPTLAGVYYHSIAIVIAGGLATSTVVTLVFLPAGYVLLEDMAMAARLRWHKLLG